MPTKDGWIYALLEELLDRELEWLEHLEAECPTDIEAGCEIDTEKLEEAYNESKKTHKKEKDIDE